MEYFKISILGWLAFASAAAGIEVSQLHLTLPAAGSSEMGLDYVATTETASIVEYWDTGTGDTRDAVSNARSESAFIDNIGYLHNVILDSLVPGASYMYRVGDRTDDSWSKWYSFINGPYSRDDFVRKGEALSSTVAANGVAAVYADLGVYNGLSVSRLQHEAARGTFDYAIHIGDIAYDLFSDNSSVGNEYMNTMSAITERIPLMVGEGNHERDDNFTEYNRRFRAVQSLAGRASHSNSNHYYSFNVGLIHYVMLSTEVYAYPVEAAAGPSPFTAEQQLDWLEADLRAASEESARKEVPWIVLMAHRPWYTVDRSKFRDIDDLACRYGADLYITGHVHNYQRWLPARLSSPLVPDDVDKECMSADGHTYTNPKYMPTIVAGSTGCHSPEPRVACPVMKAASNLFMGESLVDCSAAYGFGHLQAVNSTHLYWEFVQSHRAASIMGPTEKSHYVDSAESYLSSPEDTENIFDFYRDTMDTQHTSRQTFSDALKRSITEWIHEELQRDTDVSEAFGDNSGSRLVRDYLWIEQRNHVRRDYC